MRWRRRQGHKHKRPAPRSDGGARERRAATRPAEGDGGRPPRERNEKHNETQGGVLPATGAGRKELNAAESRRHAVARASPPLRLFLPPAGG